MLSLSTKNQQKKHVCDATTFTKPIKKIDDIRQITSSPSSSKKSCECTTLASSTNLTPAWTFRFFVTKGVSVERPRPFRKSAEAPTALNLTALGGVVGLSFWVFGSNAPESGLGLPLRGGPHDARGVEPSSDPKLKKSERSGDGSGVSICWASFIGVSI